MKLLEIVRTDDTAADVVAAGLALAKRLGKIPVVCRVCDGFVGNRILSRYRQQAEYILEEGALPQDVDAALEAFGFPMGPFAVSDLAGLDIAWARRKRLAPTRDPRERYVDVADRPARPVASGARPAPAGIGTTVPGASRTRSSPS